MWKKILLFIGIFLVVYPFVGYQFTKTKYENAIKTYEKQVGKLDRERVLSPDYSDVIGWIEIPQIHVRLPIYHGTDEAVLKKGIGHVSGSSLPIGGESTHCFLAGHRGLPDSELFVRLDELSKGDVFYLHMFGELLVYEVCEINVVAPDNTEILKVQPQRELVSLITCTPYGINSHRLIVTGERKENA